jgi:hypothetical protein
MMKTTSVVLAGLLGLVYAATDASGQVLYRETFPLITTDPPSARGTRALLQGWDVIKSRLDRLEDIEAGTAPDGVTAIVQNSGGLEGGPTVGAVDYRAEGDVGGGVNNSPNLNGTERNGMLFASAGFFPFLFFTEEGTGAMSSEVNSVRFYMRNNDPREPGSQRIHPALKIDGNWFVNDQFRVSPDNTIFRQYAIDLDKGMWAPLDVAQLDFVAGTGPDKAEIAGDFDLSKPAGTVEAWGLYNSRLTNNTRIDFVEFRSDNLEIIPEPAAASLLVLAVSAAAAARRRRAS